jgi:hypothetical protein
MKVDPFFNIELNRSRPARPGARHAVESSETTIEAEE